MSKRIVRNISLEEAPVITRHNSAGGINTDPIARLRMRAIRRSSRDERNGARRYMW
jgi:hypothetical protein